MTMLVLRLNPPIELDTPKGRGWAIIWRDYGFDHDDLWTVLISATKELWTFTNREVRGVDNVTFGVSEHKSPQKWCAVKNNPCTIPQCCTVRCQYAPRDT